MSPGTRSQVAGRWSPTLFIARSEEPRARRAGDLVTLIVSLVGLAFLALIAQPPSWLESAIVSVVAVFPSALWGLWRFLVMLASFGAVLLILAAAWRGRWLVLRDIAVALGAAILVALVITSLVTGEWQITWAARPVAELDGWVPWIRLVAPVAALAVGRPHLIRPFRVLAWWLIWLAGLGAIMLQAVAPSLGGACILIGLISAAVVALIFGSPGGRPDLATARAALADLGVAVTELSVAARQVEGVFVLNGTTPEGTRLTIKLYGRDAQDTQRVATLWRTVWFRQAGSPVSTGRIEQVAHEGLLTLLAGQSGIPTEPVVTAGLAGNGDALIVFEQVGDAVGLDDASWDRARARELFGIVQRLHALRITHGQVDHDHLMSVEGKLGLSDFRGAEVTSNPWRLQIDIVQALTTAVLAIGPEAAIEVATDLLGIPALSDALPFLQESSLTRAHRRALRQAEIDVDNLRDQVASTTGIEPPELVRLRRITIGSVLSSVLPVLAFLALASIVAGLDFDSLRSTLQGASWLFIGVGFIIAQLPRLTQSLTALGASPLPIPLGRLYKLQLAQSYIGVSIPGAPARVALNMRFFQRQGLPSGAALAVGAIDSLTGFISQLILLAVIFSVTSMTLDLDLGSGAPSGITTLLQILLAAGLGVAVVWAAVPKFRRPVIRWLKRTWQDLAGAVRGLNSPRRLMLLFGGGVATELLFATTLGAFTVALGFPVPLPELIVIVVLVGLLAGLVPIPGGIGVAEGGLMFGLARAGVPEDAAFAIAILYRAATFYLPPLWGALAFRSLQKDKQL